jgi:hypothetical protein
MLTMLGVIYTADRPVLASLAAIAESGVDTTAFVPIGPDPDEQLRLLAPSIAPAFHG